MKTRRIGAIVAAVAGTCILNCACPPPMPVIPAPKKTIGSHGEVHKVDLSFLRKGTTTRQEVETLLGWSDVGLRNRNVFWGRWRSSSALDLNRWGDQRILWRGHNLIVEFDEPGRVKRFQEFGDKDLVTTVKGWFPSPLGKGAGITQPVVIRILQSGEYVETPMEVREESLNLEAIPPIPIASVSRIECTGSASGSQIRMTLRFKRSGAELRLDFLAEVPEVVALLDVLQRKGLSILQ